MCGRCILWISNTRWAPGSFEKGPRRSRAVQVPLRMLTTLSNSNTKILHLRREVEGYAFGKDNQIRALPPTNELGELHLLTHSKEICFAFSVFVYLSIIIFNKFNG